VVTAAADSTAQLWDVETGEPLGPVLRHADSVASAAFSPDGQRVVTASYDSTARLWDARTGTGTEADSLAAFAEALAGGRATDEGAIVPLTTAKTLLREYRLRAQSDAPAPPGSLLEFLRWFFADPGTRAPLPGMSARTESTSRLTPTSSSVTPR
jgi:hypothetical protein